MRNRVGLILGIWLRADAEIFTHFMYLKKMNKKMHWKSVIRCLCRIFVELRPFIAGLMTQRLQKKRSENWWWRFGYIRFYAAQPTIENLFDYIRQTIFVSSRARVQDWHESWSSLMRVHINSNNSCAVYCNWTKDVDDWKSGVISNKVF